jgi:hypothetical protein
VGRGRARGAGYRIGARWTKKGFEKRGWKYFFFLSDALQIELEKDLGMPEENLQDAHPTEAVGPSVRHKNSLGRNRITVKV